jgi:O-antigen ligase
MQRHNIRNPLWSINLLFQIMVACSFGVLVGIGCSLFSGLLVFGVLGIVILSYATLKRPEVALLVILLATSSIVFEDQLPMVSVGISLHIPDFLLLGSFGIIILRSLVEPKFKIVRTPLDWPLLVFFGVMLLATFVATYQETVGVETARREVRIFSYYLTFFIVTNLVRERRQLNFLSSGLFFLATIVAAVMAAQYLLGSSVVLLPGRVEALNTQGVSYTGITRILPPGVSIVLVSFVATFCILFLERFDRLRWLKLLQFALLGMAILFTFLRSYWGALIMVFSLLAFVLKGDDRKKFIKWSLASITFVVIILAFIASIPDSEAAGLLNASKNRLSTIFSIETFQGQDGSLNFRKIENQYALRQVIAHPLLGLGPGSVYRPFDPRLDTEGDDLRWFIHNGHFRILLDAGLLGYLAFMGLSITFLIRGVRYWSSIADNWLKGIVLGYTLIYVVILIAAAVNSVFMQWNWTPVIGIIMGTNETIILRSKQWEPVA